MSKTIRPTEYETKRAILIDSFNVDLLPRRLSTFTFVF